MVRDAVAHRFDQDGLATFGEGHAAGTFCNFADSEDVVAVYANGVDAIANASAGDPIAAVLFKRGG